MVITPDASSTRFCDLPGSVQYTTAGKMRVDGGSGAEKVAFLEVPTGFCVHYFGSVANTRQLRFAPGGELFVASPTTGTTGGGLGGLAAIVILPDDDHDGTADAPITFLDSLPTRGDHVHERSRLLPERDENLASPVLGRRSEAVRSPSSRSSTSPSTRPAALAQNHRSSG
jgi:hypothetical protein